MAKQTSREPQPVEPLDVERLGELIGDRRLWELVERWAPAHRVFIPDEAAPFNPIKRRFGPEIASALSSLHGGRTVVVPNSGAIDSIRHGALMMAGIVVEGGVCSRCLAKLAKLLPKRRGRRDYKDPRRGNRA